MSKVITLRLSEEEYQKIVAKAKIEHRPISNFITATVLRDIEESYYVDAVEIAQMKSDENLLKRINLGHKDAKSNRGKFVE